MFGNAKREARAEAQARAVQAAGAARDRQESYAEEATQELYEAREAKVREGEAPEAAETETLTDTELAQAAAVAEGLAREFPFAELMTDATWAFDDRAHEIADELFPIQAATEGERTIKAQLYYFAIWDAAMPILENGYEQAWEDEQAEKERVRSERGVGVHGPMPAPQPFGVSHEGAEALIAAWMVYLGESDAEPTQFSGDGGIDVVSHRYIAQVKNYAGSVDVASVRELAGVSLDDGRKPLFFTSGTYTQGATDFATRVGIALFRYIAAAGTLEGANELGDNYVNLGL